MNPLDVRTVMISQLATDVICALVLAFLWYQNRRRFAGASYWVIDLSFQATATLLIVLRGAIPDWMSMVLANTLVVAGAIAGYMGLQRFVGRVSTQVHNYLLLAVFVAVHSYFLFVQPSLEARNLNLSVALLITSVQCAWLMLRRVPSSMRPMTRTVGLIFGAFCLVSIIRIAAFLAGPPPSNDFFQSGAFDTLVLLTYQMLLIVLTYGLTLMVNGRLLVEVRIQEEKFAKAFRSSPYAITLTRLSDGQILEVNDGFVNLSGYQYAEVVGGTVPGLGLWAREEDRAAAIQELRQSGRVHGSEYQFRRKSGELLTGLFSAEIFTIDNQQWVLSSINDITERKREEEQLAYQAKLLSLVNDAIVASDAHYSLTAWNVAAEAMYGWKAEEVIGRPGLDITRTDYGTKTDKDEMLRMIAEKGAWRGEVTQVRKDGTRFPVEASCLVLHDETGKASGYVSVNREITERKRVEGLLRARMRLLEYADTHSLEEILRKTLDEVGELTNSPIGFYHFLEADQQTLSLQAWSTRTLQEFCTAAGQGTHYSIADAGVWVECVRQRRPVIHNDYASLPNRKGMPEGHAQVVRELVAPIMRGERIVAILGIGNKPSDYTQEDVELVSYLADVAWTISERKRAEEMAQTFSAELAHSNKELEQFAYVASHDLQEPLRMVSSFLGLIARRYKGRLDADADEFIAYAVDGADRMQRMINDLLALSRVGTRGKPFQPVNLVTVLGDVLDNLHVAIQSSEAVVTQDDLPTVLGDATQLSQLFQNLIGNAIKFRGEEAPRVHVSALRSGHGWEFAVGDNGIGIDPRHFERVFVVFQRVNEKAQYPGTGIGLAICKKIVERHHGHIWVASAPGQGANVHFTLPDAPASAGSPANRPESSIPSRQLV
jgi:PAS domain S-box-containing protein